MGLPSAAEKGAPYREGLTVRESFNSAGCHSVSGRLHLLVLDSLDYLLVKKVRGHSYIPSCPYRPSVCKLQFAPLERRERLTFEVSVNPVTLVTSSLAIRMPGPLFSSHH